MAHFSSSFYEKLAQDYQTPLYIYKREIIEQQIDKLNAAFSCPIKIKYAMKALSNPHILKVMLDKKVGIDAVSINEVKLALKVGFKAEEILFTPNCVAFEEIEEAIKLGVQINIDNLYHLELLANQYSKVKVFIRINPHIMAGGNSKISTGHIDSKFGISIHQIGKVLELEKRYKLNITGLHVHTGSDILEADVFLQVADVIFSIADKFTNLEVIDFGSGFKVPYFNGDSQTNLLSVGEKLSKKFHEYQQKRGINLEMWFEPGKFLVSAAGELLVKCNLVKITPSRIFVGVDSGLNHLIRPMMYDSHHEIENVSNLNGEEHIYTVVGQICETDTFAYNRILKKVEPGHLLILKNAGAYGFSMASNYNLRTRPAEVLVTGDEVKIIRLREKFDDLEHNVAPFT